MFKVESLTKDKETAKVSNTIDEDLNLNILKDILETEEYNVFINIIKKPLLNVEDIKERQLVIKDFLKFPNLIRELYNITLESESLRIKPNSLYAYDKNVQTKLKLSIEQLKDNLNIFNKTIKLPNSLNNLLENKEFSSKLLCELKNNNIENLNEFSKIKELVNTISDELFSKKLNIKIKFGKGFKFERGYLLSHKSNVSLPKKKKAKNNEISFNNNFILDNSLHEILLRAVLKHCDVIEVINKTILELFQQLKVHICFYMAALKIINFMNKNNLHYCFPTFLDKPLPIINALGIYDIGLATYVKYNDIQNIIVENDFNYDNNKIFIVSGLNQGGKTTFLKSIGISQLFAQAGLIVPAKKYSCSVFNSIITHFNKAEDITIEKGKFKEELYRLKENLKMIKKNNLILFNEPFSSTTNMIGTDVSFDILKALSYSQSIIIFVTHLYELTRRVNELNEFFGDTQAINLVSQFKQNTNEIERQYRIVIGEPTKNINISMFEDSIKINT